MATTSVNFCPFCCTSFFCISSNIPENLSVGQISSERVFCCQGSRAFHRATFISCDRTFASLTLQSKWLKKLHPFKYDYFKKINILSQIYVYGQICLQSIDLPNLFIDWAVKFGPNVKTKIFGKDFLFTNDPVVVQVTSINLNHSIMVVVGMKHWEPSSANLFFIKHRNYLCLLTPVM